MPPKPKFSVTDEKGLTWIYNYVKSLPGYADATRETFITRYNKELLGIISQNTKWSDGSKQRAYFTVAKWLTINHPNLKIIDQYREIREIFQDIPDDFLRDGCTGGVIRIDQNQKTGCRVDKLFEGFCRKLH